VRLTDPVWPQADGGAYRSGNRPLHFYFDAAKVFSLNTIERVDGTGKQGLPASVALKVDKKFNRPSFFN
jgi:hypothetical protein